VAAEIERKYLVRTDGWRRRADGGTPIVQGYLAVAPQPEVRVRRAGDLGFVTVKTGRGLVRTEHEWPLPPQDADRLLTGCPALVEKVRHRVPVDDLVWEVDVYRGRHAGLVVAEVELPTADHPLTPPEWVGEEVTGDRRYGNAALALHGLPGARPAVYVASALGPSEAGRRYAADVLLPALRDAGLEPLDPWDLPDDPTDAARRIADAPARREALARAQRAVAARRGALIRSASGVFAVLDGPEIDSGTAAEIGFAAALGIPCVGVRTDLRSAGDNEATVVNPQVEWFIESTGGAVHRDVPAAVAALAASLRT
jgi:CYTH domain-containing protein/nucleoside 2-deoxyribosyltransferase